METQQNIIEQLKKSFRENSTHSESEIVVRSPGRINLIGEHTDYNEGFVLPSAIDKAIYLLVTPRDGFSAGLFSLDFDDVHSFDVRSPLKTTKEWANYLIGVVDQMKKLGRNIGGFDCHFAGNIPIGAGMSSSAALETGFAFALNGLFGLGLDRKELARIGQKSENEFVGVKCGIMDQFASVLSKGNSALLLDCRSLSYELIPFTRTDLKFLLCDTGVKHSLAASEYNLKREQCETGVEVIKKRFSSIRSLRDVDEDKLEECRDGMEPVVYKRCKFVLDENSRVQSGRLRLTEDDYGGFGKLMYASHDGLKNMYEVSCEELDFLVDTASSIDGILGSRMMGGGFGGCTLTLLENGHVEEFNKRVSETYLKHFGRIPKIYECSLMPGTSIIED